MHGRGKDFFQEGQKSDFSGSQGFFQEGAKMVKFHFIHSN